MSYSEEISNKLNELLVKNYDAEKGYLNAMSNVDDKNLKIFFKRRASERSQFAKELRTEILRYGEVPEDSGTFKGTVHRNWMSLRATFSSNKLTNFPALETQPVSRHSFMYLYSWPNMKGSERLIFFDIVFVAFF